MVKRAASVVFLLGMVVLLGGNCGNEKNVNYSSAPDSLTVVDVCETPPEPPALKPPPSEFSSDLCWTDSTTTEIQVTLAVPLAVEIAVVAYVWPNTLIDTLIQGPAVAGEYETLWQPGRTGYLGVLYHAGDYYEVVKWFEME